jgi:hypothetical protein
MASTFSPSLKLELIGNGDQSGTWGTTTNTNLGTLLEQAITGVQAITMVNANVTLTSLNGVSDEARNAVLVLGGTNSAIRSIIAPSVNKTYIVANNTVGGFAVIIKTSAGAGLSIANGATQLVYCDGTEFYPAGFSNSGGTITGNVSIGGTLGVTGATTLSNLTASSAVATNASKVLVSVANSGTGDNVLTTGATLSSPTLNSPTLTAPALGTPASGVLTNCTGTAAGLTAGNATNAVNSTTQVTGTNNTTIATTAFVQTALQLLYPIGSIYTATVATNPATLFGFGTWTAYGAGRVLIGNGGGYSAGATGGSADAVVVSHAHSASSSSSSSVSDPGHRHVFGADDQIASQGGYNIVGGFPYDAKSGGGGGGVELLTKNTSLANAGETTGISVSTSTSTSITAAGVSGTNANLQPYVVVYMWNRTA